MNTDNRVALLLFYLGVINIVLGIMLGFIFGNNEVQGLYSSYTEFSWTLFLIWAISGVVSGLLFIGFSEVINLLHKINKNIEGNQNNEN